MAPSTRKGKAKAPTTATELAATAGLDAESDFASPALATLDSSLRCDICSEVYTAPVMISVCGHTFDSRCIHEHFNVKRDCPVCHREAFVDHLIRNLVLDKLVANWKAARTALLELQSAAELASNSRDISPKNSLQGNIERDGAATRGLESAMRSGPSRSGSKGKAATSASSSPAPRVKREHHDDDSSDIEILEDKSAPAKPSKKPRLRSPPVQLASPADLTDPEVLVQCPLCTRTLKNAFMSSHLDRCNGVPPADSAAGPSDPSQGWTKLLSTSNSARTANGRSSKDRSDPSNEGARLDTSKKLPLGSYQHRKVGQLVEMLQKYNLPTTVPATCLTNDAKISCFQRRHRQFVTIWNSNADLDSEHPAHKTEKQLRQELARWEKDQDAAEGKGEIGESHARKYAEHFRELIAQARASQAAAERKAQRGAAPEEAEPGPLRDEESTMDNHEHGEEPPAPAARKKSVRLVSPPRSSPPVDGPPVQSAPFSADENGSSPPQSSPLLDATILDWQGAGVAGTTGTENRKQDGSRRSPSPYDPAGPRPSQRNRDEERMFVEMHGVDPEDESFQEQEADVSGLSEAAGQAGKSEIEATVMAAV